MNPISYLQHKICVNDTQLFQSYDIHFGHSRIRACLDDEWLHLDNTQWCTRMVADE